MLWILASLDDRPNAETLYKQSTLAEVQGGPATMLELAMPPTAERADVPDGPLPVRAVAYERDGVPLGEVLVWVSDGLLSAIEYAWYTDVRPTELPAADHFRRE